MTGIKLNQSCQALPDVAILETWSPLKVSSFQKIMVNLWSISAFNSISSDCVAVRTLAAHAFFQESGWDIRLSLSSTKASASDCYF